MPAACLLLPCLLPTLLLLDSYPFGVINLNECFHFFISCLSRGVLTHNRKATNTDSKKRHVLDIEEGFQNVIQYSSSVSHSSELNGFPKSSLLSLKANFFLSSRREYGPCSTPLTYAVCLLYLFS